LDPVPDSDSNGTAGEHRPSGEVPDHIPGYEVLELLGRGGMGVVYKARQVKLNRVVALKMIRAGAHAGEADLARFRTEAQAIARLQHPNIVQIYEVGEHDGLPFFSLEFCPGGSLEKKLVGTPLPPRDAAALVERLARAMHAVHTKGVIHRDLKPANVLLTADGTPKITDFGLAKLEQVGQTVTGAILGTPSYMAPEQAGGKRQQVGSAADVYALGALLYELLTGRPPFKGPTTFDTLRQVLNDEPVPPRHMQPTTPRDLETVCLKCLHKDPAKRYASAEALAEDLRRFQAHEPVLARQVGKIEQIVKWARRRPTAAALLVVSILAGLTLLLGGVTFTHSLRLERDSARFQLDRARRSVLTAQLLRVAAVYENNPWLGRELLEDAESCPPDLRDFAWGYYYQLCRHEDRTLATWSNGIRSMVLSPDGRFFALVGNDEVQIRDTHNGRETLSIPVSYHIDALAFDQGSQLLMFPGQTRIDRDFKEWSTVRLWDLTARKELDPLENHAGRISSLAFSPDGRTLAVGSRGLDDKEKRGYSGVKLWEIVNRKEEAILQSHTGQVTCLAFSPDGRTLACGDAGIELEASENRRRVLRIWDTKTGVERTVPLGPRDFPQSLCFSPDSQLLALGSYPFVKLLDVASLQFVATFGEHPRDVHALSFRADGKILAAASGDTVKLWDLTARKHLANLQPHGPYPDSLGFVRGAAFNPDGDLITATRFDAAVSGKFHSTQVRLWNNRRDEVARSRCIAAGQFLAFPVSFSADGQTLATFVRSGVVLLNVVTGKKMQTFSGDRDHFLLVGRHF
jgi:WD40 repeat protein/tRNA A-37 threonylcarbamoyl transferase component Bud32